MRVLFVPRSGPGNPYERELAQALTNHGAHVSMSYGVSWLPTIGAIGAHGKPDVLHLHWTHLFLISRNRTKSLIKALRFVAELLVVRLSGTKIVWTVHNLLNHEKLHPQIELLFNRIAVRLCDQLIVHCPFARDAVMQTYHLPARFLDRVSVIPHGNYMDSYENSVTPEQARAELDLSDREAVYLYFGLIRPYKGVLQLVEKFRQLQDARARLVVAGRPATYAIGEELAQRCGQDSRISAHLHFIPDDKVQLYMNAADVVVLPYRDILTSGVVVLAMSFGKPGIVPRMGCIPEVLDDESSLLYDPSDEEGLVKAMRLALHADLAGMARHSLELAKELRWDDIGRRTYELYQRCLSN